jgi:hypothetical protein
MPQMATVQDAARPEREPLAGLVERVTYHNADNGWTVLRVKVRGHRDLITVVGHVAAISPGEFIQACVPPPTSACNSRRSASLRSTR